MQTNTTVTLKPNFILVVGLYFFKYTFPSITLIILNLHIRRLKIFPFHTFGPKCFLHLYIPCSSCTCKYVKYDFFSCHKNITARQRDNAAREKKSYEDF